LNQINLFLSSIRSRHIISIFELKRESNLKDFVETSDNPFDSGQSMIGLGNKKSKKENKFEKLR